MNATRTSRVIVLDVRPDVMPAVEAALATAGISLGECIGGKERLRAHRVTRPATLPGAASTPDSGPASYGISRAEMDVLRLLAEGMTVRDAATKLCLAVETVHSHMTVVARRLGVRGKPATIAAAYRLGIVGGAA